MTHLPRILLTLSALLGLATAGCLGAEGDDQTCTGAKCDDLDDSEVPDSPCDGILLDLSGNDHEKVAGRLNDPLANAAFKVGDDCPASFQELVEKLEANQQNCDVQTRVVSETASTIGADRGAADAIANAGYRAVTSRACDGGQPWHLVFSQFGVTAESAAPEDYEAIAFDSTAGVFNYYKLHGDGTFAFFGNSKQFLDGPGEEVAAGGVTTEIRDCANCHPGGGLIMKELRSPWVHWDEFNNLPGSSDVVANNSDVYGSKASAANMEFQITRAANRVWNDTRIDHLIEDGDTARVLEPLFCAVEINLATSGQRLPALIDGALGRVRLSADSSSLYNTILAEHGQQMIIGAAIEIDAVETSSGNVFIERSAIDEDYVQKLVARGIVDDEFVRAVKMVDFTRPVFSDDRCALLEHAPAVDFSGDDVAAQIRDGFVANLEGLGAAGGELRANLVDGVNQSAIDDFEAACDGLGEEGVRNAMQMLSLQRSKARDRRIMEFPGSMPFDMFQPGPGAETSIDAKARLSPKSCNVVTRFVSAR